MIRINQIKIEIDTNRLRNDEELRNSLIRRAAKTLRVSFDDVDRIRIARHGIDARKKPVLFDVYSVDVLLKKGNEESVVKKCRDRNVSIVSEKKYDFLEMVKRNSGADEAAGSGSPGKRIVIVGFGPAGMFCGYELAKAGLRPVIFERGADVDTRLLAVNRFWETGVLDETTNVQFGEGGAGTFSDGKLNTMVKDKEGRGEEALDIFVRHGAPEKIKYESKPHIGTDILVDVVKNLRKSIQDFGGEVIFNSRVDDIIVGESGRIEAVKCDEKLIECSAVVLAIGHSARDTFRMLVEKKALMVPKPFAVGFRVEHPQSLINQSQYGIADPKALPAAPYKLTATTSKGRGVYSFCMCPGGFVVNASSEEGMLAVNGMSYSKRDGKNANSAIIITIDPRDFGGDDVLGGVEFQRSLERKAFELAQGKIPVEYYRDFKRQVEGSKSTDEFLPDNPGPGTGRSHISSQSFPEDFVPRMKGNYKFCDVHSILPTELNEAFVEGMESFGRTIMGFNDDHALVSGVESRTSSPVRIVRGIDGQSETIKGLYPCGEGAGYAGGIMSAAMDGIRTAELLAGAILTSET